MNMSEVKIANMVVGAGYPTMIIAEVGINHNGDFETARELVRQAHKAGASAVKLQTYTTERRVPKDSPIFGILKKCELSYDQQAQLIDLGRELGVEVFSTPFDEQAVEFLNKTGVACHKVASFDIVNLKLLRAIAQSRKPVIMSRGMATAAEVEKALEIFKRYGVPVILLHCVSAYPVSNHKDLNLATIRALESQYGCPVGFSDHTIGPEAAVAAVYAGACAIEKHFTLSCTQEGPDHAMSADPEGLARLVLGIRRAEEMMGKPVRGPIKTEEPILQYRRPSDAP